MSKALELANEYLWDDEHCAKAAAELRRLYAINAELIEALKGLASVYDAMDNPRGPKRVIADAAISKAQELSNEL